MPLAFASAEFFFASMPRTYQFIADPDKPIFQDILPDFHQSNTSPDEAFSVLLLRIIFNLTRFFLSLPTNANFCLVPPPIVSESFQRLVLKNQSHNALPHTPIISLFNDG